MYSRNHRNAAAGALAIAALLIVAACASPTPTPTPELVPTREVIVVVVTATPEGAPPAPTPTRAIGAGPGGCTLVATYIADVTIPDHTVMDPNTPFVKTWRVRNDGTCTWDNYQLVFAGGNQMSGPSATPVPVARPGQTIDVSVNLVSPGAPGSYSGYWRFRATNGAVFGGLTVVIDVKGPPTPTPIIPVSQGPWSGTWQSSYGDIVMTQSGNSVTGSYYGGTASLTGSVYGNQLSGTYRESSGQTGTFDFWMYGNGQQWHGNYDLAGGWCGQRPGYPAPYPCSVSSWYGTWQTTCSVNGFDCGVLSLSQSGDTVYGTFANGAGKIDGQVNGTTLAGTVTVYPGTPSQVSAPVQLVMTSNGVQFTGSAGNGVSWCGYRYNAGYPACPTPF